MRTLGFLALWVVLIGPGLLDLAVGVFAAAAAAWTSLRLTPPVPSRLRWSAVLAVLPYFLWKSLLAGADVAWRALAWRVRVNPGFITYPVALEVGTPRTFFAMFTSLMPGTLPCADEAGGLVYHCLDIERAVAADLAKDEALLAATLKGAGDE
ncbi:MAG: Na+/H+ antiporter subunit E [Burkholderiaceae bacterium]